MTIPPIGIAIVAPSGYGSNEAALERGIALLQAHGCSVHNYFEPARVFQRFGASDAQRVGQLNAAAANPDVQVVMALRGQYGLTRLLPHIDFASMAASEKIFVGFSDFTAFSMALFAKTGALSYAGPMFYTDFTPATLDHSTLDDFWRCLAGPSHSVHGSGAGNPAVSLSGPVWGGNLAMLASMVGTEYFPVIEGGILFVEDVNEHPYRVERMLLQLLQAGILGKQKALLFGEISNYRLSDADNGYDFAAMLAYLRATLPIPVLTGLPFGHQRTRVTIPFGAPATLVSEGDDFTLHMSNYPTIGER